jgi:simple sugar transport system substrate-binding protein
MNNFNRRKFLKTTGAIVLTSTLSFELAHAAGKKLIVGFIYVGPRDDFGYNQSHAVGASAIKQMSGIQMVDEEKVGETVAVQKSMEAMIRQDDVSLIFPTSFGYFDPHVIKIAKKYPKVRFAHCGGLWTKGKHPMNSGSFFGYIEECQYLNGVIAGYMSKSKKLGFVAAKPIPQVLRNINAFTMGAQLIDPSIKTHLIFTGDWSMPIKEAEATNSLIDQGVDVLTCHVDGPKVVVETAEKRGAMSCGYHVSQASLAPKGYLTGAEWNWTTPYTTIVKATLEGKPMINFLRGGLRDGFVRMSPYGASVSAEAKGKANEIQNKMLAGQYPIFKGPLKDNKGKVVIPAGVIQEQTAIELESMSYLVAGVIGKV